jgi:lactoylglutathione lyase
MKGFTSVGHVAIRVNDVDRSLAFYVGKLGFPEMFRLHRDNGDLWLIYLRITDSQYLEIFPDAVGERAPDRNANANGLNHFCLTVDNMDNVLRDLAAANISLFQQLKVGPDGNRQAWIEDPDGNRIELLEMAPTCMQFEALNRLATEMNVGS